MSQRGGGGRRSERELTAEKTRGGRDGHDTGRWGERGLSRSQRERGGSVFLTPEPPGQLRCKSRGRGRGGGTLMGFLEPGDLASPLRSPL
ncbi:unnamed protein product [Lampetra planeri]